MTLTESLQYESQGWPHKHDWKFSHQMLGYINIYKCRCGKHMMKLGDFEHMME